MAGGTGPTKSVLVGYGGVAAFVRTLGIADTTFKPRIPVPTRSTFPCRLLSAAQITVVMTFKLPNIDSPVGELRTVSLVARVWQDQSSVIIARTAQAVGTGANHIRLAIAITQTDYEIEHG
jgi:hypothetical protein